MFTVVWRADILDELADIYVAADEPERDRMATGLESLNRRLARDPFKEGESREDSLRVTFTDLLIVRFLVDEMTRSVQVIGVGRYGR